MSPRPAAKHLYSRFIQIGRIVLIQFGPEAGKLATVIDIVDQNRILIDGPEAVTGVKRQVINVKWLAVTDIAIKTPRNSRAKTLTAAWAAGEVLKKWEATAWAKKIAAKKAKASMNDFERFSAKLASQKRSKAIKAKLA